MAEFYSGFSRRGEDERVAKAELFKHLEALIGGSAGFLERGMTQDKIKSLKTSLNAEFAMIHELCEFVLTNSQKPELILKNAGDVARCFDVDSTRVHL